MTAAEQRLAAILREHQDELLARWTGYEKILLFDLVRALDDAALGLMLPANDDSVEAGRTVLLGCARALHPLLQGIKGAEGGVPWAAQPAREFAILADSHVFYCGQLANLLRLAALERYGLATVTFIKPSRP